MSLKVIGLLNYNGAKIVFFLDSSVFLLTFPVLGKPCKDLHSLGFWIIFVENVAAMSDLERIQLFESKRVRTVWNEKEEKWYCSVLDVIEVLTDSKAPTDYFKKMRKREAGK